MMNYPGYRCVCVCVLCCTRLWQAAGTVMLDSDFNYMWGEGVYSKFCGTVPNHDK